jgi:hypothetical protein
MSNSSQISPTGGDPIAIGLEGALPVIRLVKMTKALNRAFVILYQT